VNIMEARHMTSRGWLLLQVLSRWVGQSYDEASNVALKVSRLYTAL